MDELRFEWDQVKNLENRLKHGVSFQEATFAFLDSRRVILVDDSHSQYEQRYHCLGKDRNGDGVLTVRFTYRNRNIRIIGAGYWRKGTRIYEQKN